MVPKRYSHRFATAFILIGLAAWAGGLSAQEIVMQPLLNLYKGTLNGAALSPDGTEAVVAEGAEAYLYNTQVSHVDQLLELSGHAGVIRSVSFSPDGKTVLTGSDDGTARVWNATSGQTILVLKGDGGPVLSAAYSPDGLWVVTGCLDDTAVVWDALTGTRALTLTGHTLGVNSVAWSHNGTRILTGSWDRTVRLWDAGTGDLLKTFSGVWSPVAFSPDDTEFAAGGPNYTAKLVDIETSQVLQTFTGHQADIASVGFSPYGNRLVTGSWDWTSRIWNVATGETVQLFEGHQGGVVSVQFSPDSGWILSAATAPDNRALIWYRVTGAIYLTLPGHYGPAYAVAFTPDGSEVVGGGGDNQVRTWDAATGQLLKSFEGHTDPVRSVAVSPDGSQILSGSYDGTARLWSSSTGEQLRTIPDLGHVTAVAFTPGGNRMITGGTAQLRVYDSEGDLLRTFGENVDEMAVSPDGERIAAGPSYNSSVSFYETRTGQLLGSAPLSYGGLQSVAYSPDGRYVAAGWHVVIVDASTFQQLAVYDPGGSGAGQSMAYSPDGQYIAEGGSGGEVALLKVATGEFVRIFRPLNAYTPVYKVAFSPDGTRIASATTYGIQVWDSGLPAYPVNSEIHYLFNDTTNGWESVSTSAFTPPSAAFWPSQPGGLLLRATNNTSTFGYWVGPLTRFGSQVQQLDPKPLSLQSPSEAVYVARFLVRTHVTEPSQVPQLRLRMSEEDGRQSNFLSVESGADGVASPNPNGGYYYLPFTATPAPGGQTDLDGRLAFDLLNFDPQDDPTGDLQIGSVDIVRHDVGELGEWTLLKTYDFTKGSDGWTSHSVAPFQSPVFGTDGEALTVSGPGPTDGTPQVFGYWSSPEGDIPSFNQSGPVLYRATFEVESSLPEADRSLVPQFRVRLNDGTQHAASVLAIESKGDGGRSPVTGSPSTYVVYYVPPVPNPSPTQLVTTGSSLQASFDYVNFDAGDDPSATLRLLGVTVEAVSVDW